MGDSSTQLHEKQSDLADETLDRHRAIVSLMEELEAVDWYQQRIDATDDEQLAEILRHNRDEEKEHAAMSLEWLRRRDDQLDGVLREYLFSDRPIAGREAAESDSASEQANGELDIGSLRPDKEEQTDG